jgi:hypothetical protein
MMGLQGLSTVGAVSRKVKRNCFFLLDSALFDTMTAQGAIQRDTLGIGFMYNFWGGGMSYVASDSPSEYTNLSTRPTIDQRLSLISFKLLLPAP